MLNISLFKIIFRPVLLIDLSLSVSGSIIEQIRQDYCKFLLNVLFLPVWKSSHEKTNSFFIHSGIPIGFNFQSPSPNLNPPTWCNYSAEFEDRDRSSPLKPALKSNMRQHVTVGSNFSINPSDGCRKCGTFFFVKCTRIHVHAVLGDWLIYYISTLTLYISNLYTGFWHRHLPENSVRDIGVWQTT